MSKGNLPVALAFILLATCQSFAQTTPPPDTPPQPFTSWIGRLLDSVSTMDYQAPNRTLRADTIKIDRARDRIYMKAGGGYFFAYQLSTFISQFSGPLATGAHGEKYRQPLFKVNPETPGSGWATIAMDGQERLSDFDFDSRGYVYLAYGLWGFGTVDFQGHLVKQVTASDAGITPAVLFTFASDGHQYLMISDRQSSVLWDVSDPASPQKVRTFSFAFSAWATTATAIAVVTPFQNYQTPNSVKIFTPAQLVGDGTPTDIQTHSNAYSFDAVTTDATKFYAVEHNVNANFANVSIISTISASPSGFNKNEILTPTEWIGPSDLTYGSGYLALAGYDGSGGSVALFWRWNGTGFEAFDPRSFVQGYYTGSYAYVRHIVPYCTAEGAYAIVGAHALADVFSLTPATASCLPGAPQSAAATADDGSATVSFSPPALDGGSAITSYTVLSSPGGITATGTESPVTVSGLTNGTTYTFTVTARNEVGIGPASAPSNAATPGSTLIPPAIMYAAASGTTQVNVTWSAAAKADHYEVFRSANGSAFEVVASPTAVAYADLNVLPDTTYLYKVRSVDSASNPSESTPADPATTIFFTDDPLSAAVAISAVHIEKLRTAVNAIRAAAGLDPVTFTDADLGGMPVRAVHVSELRSGLNEALAQLGFTALSYVDPDITPGVTPVRAIHLQQLRDAVK